MDVSATHIHLKPGGRPGQMTTAARNYKNNGKIQLKENKTRDVIELDREKEEERKIYRERLYNAIGLPSA